MREGILIPEEELAQQEQSVASLVEQYRETIEQQSSELKETAKSLRQLHADYEALM